MKAKKLRVLRVAIHEAAHAVAAVDLELGCCSATIVAKDTMLGHILVNPPFGEIVKDRSREILALLAGPIAEWRFRTAVADEHGRRRPVYGCGSDSDLENAERLIESMDRIHDRHAYFERVVAHTDRWVHSHWDQIARVAMALIEQKTVSGVEVAAIMAETNAEAAT